MNIGNLIKIVEDLPVYLGCPYCKSLANGLSCCGEAHYELLYEYCDALYTQGELYNLLRDEHKAEIGEI